MTETKSGYKRGDFVLVPESDTKNVFEIKAIDAENDMALIVWESPGGRIIQHGSVPLKVLKLVRAAPKD